MKTSYYMFHGIPGSGKSTQADLHAKKLDELNTPYVRLNRDNLRTDVAGEEYHKSGPSSEVEKEVNKLFEGILSEAFEKKIAVVDDNTNLNLKTMKTMRNKINTAGYKLVHIFVDVPVRTAWDRNKSRGAAGGRLVPYFVIKSMASKAYNEDMLTINYELFVEDGEEFLILDSNEVLPDS